MEETKQTTENVNDGASVGQTTEQATPPAKKPRTPRKKKTTTAEEKPKKELKTKRTARSKKKAEVLAEVPAEPVAEPIEGPVTEPVAEEAAEPQVSIEIQAELQAPIETPAEPEPEQPTDVEQPKEQSKEQAKLEQSKEQPKEQPKAEQPKQEQKKQEPKPIPPCPTMLIRNIVDLINAPKQQIILNDQQIQQLPLEEAQKRFRWIEGTLALVLNYDVVLSDTNIWIELLTGHTSSHSDPRYNARLQFERQLEFISRLTQYRGGRFMMMSETYEEIDRFATMQDPVSPKDADMNDETTCRNIAARLAKRLILSQQRENRLRIEGITSESHHSSFADPAIIRRTVELFAQGKKVLLLTNDASVAIRSMGMCDDLQRTNDIDDDMWDDVYAPIRPMVMTFDDLKVLDAYTRQYHFLQMAAGKSWMEDVPQRMERRTIVPLFLWLDGFRPGDRYSEKKAIQKLQQQKQQQEQQKQKQEQQRQEQQRQEQQRQEQQRQKQQEEQQRKQQQEQQRRQQEDQRRLEEERKKQERVSDGNYVGQQPEDKKDATPQPTQKVQEQQPASPFVQEAETPQNTEPAKEKKPSRSRGGRRSPRKTNKNKEQQ